MRNGDIAFFVESIAIISQIVDRANSKFANVTGIDLPRDGLAARSLTIGVRGMGIPSSAPRPDASVKSIEWAGKHDLPVANLSRITVLQHHR